MASRRTIRITDPSAIRMTEKASLEDRAADPAQRSRPELSLAQREAIQADRSAFLLHFAARWALSRRSILSARKDVFRLGASLDHMGPLARTVEDAALMLEAMAGRKFPVNSRTDVRIGMPENFYFDDLDPEIHVAIEHAAKRAEKMGAKIVPRRVPDPDGLMSTARTILLCEAATVMLPHVKPRHEFGADVLALLDTGVKVPATEYINAVSSASRLKEHGPNNLTLRCAPHAHDSYYGSEDRSMTVHIGHHEEDTRLLSRRDSAAASICWDIPPCRFRAGKRRKVCPSAYNS